MKAEAVKWAALMLWIGFVSALVVINTDVPLWFAGGVLGAWLAIFIRLWPAENDR